MATDLTNSNFFLKRRDYSGCYRARLRTGQRTFNDLMLIWIRKGKSLSNFGGTPYWIQPVKTFKDLNSIMLSCPLYMERRKTGTAVYIIDHEEISIFYRGKWILLLPGEPITFPDEEENDG